MPLDTMRKSAYYRSMDSKQDARQEHTNMMTAQQQIALIRKYIKTHVPGTSVRNGTGTAWGWVDISAAGGGSFTPEQLAGLKAIDLTPGGNWCVMDRDERERWAEAIAAGQTPGRHPLSAYVTA